MESISLPNNLDAERAVLGSLMLGAHAYSDVHDYLSPQDFYRDAHSKLFKLMLVMINEQIPIELASIAQKVVDSGMADAVGGLPYLSGLLNQVASSHNIEYYATVVKEHSIRRTLLKNVQDISKLALTRGEDLNNVLEFAEKKIFEITQTNNKRTWQEIAEVVDEQFERIQKLMEQSNEVTGMDTGFTDLNKILAGLQKTDLVILAARPAMGKTALALNIALNVARNGNGVGVFSLEMSAGQLVTRLLCTEGLVDAGKVRTGLLSREVDLPKLSNAAEVLYTLPIFLDDSPGINISQLRSKARRLKANNANLGLIVVDYIGLMSGDPRSSRQEQVSASSRGLKALAKELDVCVLALSQLNRGVEQRTDKRPLPSDLRESGAIEQDADIITFIYRDEYYNEDTPDKGIAEIIIAKQRNGSTGTVQLNFEGKHTRFFNRDPRTDEYI
jgi:replicative DNA helicase